MALPLLESALAIARKIPSTDPYFDEREFCWRKIGEGALAAGHHPALAEALAAVERHRSRVHLMLAALRHSTTESAALLPDVLQRPSWWAHWLYPAEVSELAAVVSSHLGPEAAMQAGNGLFDAWDREGWAHGVSHPPAGSELTTKRFGGRLTEHLDTAERASLASVILEYAPTQFVSAILTTPETEAESTLRTQLRCAADYHRNDLRVEFLVDAQIGFLEAGISLFPSLEEVLVDLDFTRVQPPAPPRFSSRDPSLMNLAEFAVFLFDRPVAATEDEERFMDRRSDLDPETFADAA